MKAKFLLLSLLAVVPMVSLCGCGSSSTTTETIVYTPIEELPIKQISDTEGKIFKEVKAGMTKDMVQRIFGVKMLEEELYEGKYNGYYRVSSIPDLDSYVTSTIDIEFEFQFDFEVGYRFDEYEYKKFCELPETPYIYYFDFNKSGKLNEWKIFFNYDDSSYRTKIADYMRNTIVPIFKEDYPDLNFRSNSNNIVYAADAYIEANMFRCGYDDYDYDYDWHDHFTLVPQESQEIWFWDSRYDNSNQSNSGNYNKNDSYYRNNDSDRDGYINDKEFQNAVGDFMDDHGY